MTEKHECIVAVHHGHCSYTMKEYISAKDADDLDCCGGTELAKYCYKCGKKIKWNRVRRKRFDFQKYRRLQDGAI